MRIHCRVGLFRQYLDVPGRPFTLTRDGRTMKVEDFFEEASVDRDGTPHVVPRLDYGELEDNLTAWPQSEPTSIPALQGSLNILTGNPAEKSNSPTVGIVLADELPGHQHLLGLMFDQAFEPQSRDSSKRLAREGVAVFLNAIRRIRTESTVANEFAFVLVHEMGHLFNLWHIENRDNFMATSAYSQPYGDSAYHFEDAHKEWLRQCDSDPYVQPCGLSWIGDNALEGAAAAAMNVSRAKIPLDLRLDVSHREFWPFEPVQLEVSLSLAKGRKNPVTIPDCIDPGYSAFRVFIETPEGERLRYRPCVRYCPHQGTQEVAAGRPFLRDISIFGQAGGYTFCLPGTHRLFAQLELPGKSMLTSNTVEVFVKGPHDTDSEHRSMRAVLTRPNTAKFLFHRAGRPAAGTRNNLLELCRTLGSQPLTAAIHYTLGRAALKETHGHGKRAQTRRQQALDDLKRALDSASLGNYQRVKALAMLETGEP